MFVSTIEKSGRKRQAHTINGKIFQYLTDPSWWFATVLVGILASLLAAYLKDYIGKFLSLISHRYRIWKEKSDYEQHILVTKWASDQTLLLLANFRLVRSLILVAAMTTCFIGMFIIALVAFPQGSIMRTVLLLLTLGTGILTMIPMYNTMNMQGLVIKANSQYRRRLLSVPPNTAVERYEPEAERT